MPFGRKMSNLLLSMLKTENRGFMDITTTASLELEKSEVFEMLVLIGLGIIAIIIIIFLMAYLVRSSKRKMRR